jgi:hypothetical protein
LPGDVKTSEDEDNEKPEKEYLNFEDWKMIMEVYRFLHAMVHGPFPVLQKVV